jgi:hypothetical protein
MICFTILDVFLGPMHYSPSLSMHSYRLWRFWLDKNISIWQATGIVSSNWLPSGFAAVSLTRHPNYPGSTLARHFLAATSATSADFLGFGCFQRAALAEARPLLDFLILLLDHF